MDINFNTSYGDISIVNNDINIIKTKEKDLVQKIIQTIRTNYKDYEFSEDYGCNLDTYIGLEVSPALAEEIKNNILFNIKKENNLLYSVDIDIPYIIEKNTIHYRIMIDGLDTIRYSFVKDKGFKLP